MPDDAPVITTTYFTQKKNKQKKNRASDKNTDENKYIYIVSDCLLFLFFEGQPHILCKHKNSVYNSISHEKIERIIVCFHSGLWSCALDIVGPFTHVFD